MSWFIAAIGITSMWLLGYERKALRAVGFGLGLLNQGIWIVYAVATAQFGFVPAALIYGSTCARNLWRLQKKESAEADKLRALIVTIRAGITPATAYPETVAWLERTIEEYL